MTKHTVQVIERPKKRRKRDYIRKGCLKIYEIWGELDLEHRRVTWDEAEDGLWNGIYKGIDDWIMREQNNKERIKKVA